MGERFDFFLFFCFLISIFLSHSTIIAYGVSMPDTRREFGKASIWLPLTALRCGTTCITSISYDETAGLLVCGDEEGYLVLFEIIDKKTSTGCIDLLKKINEQTFIEGDELAASSSGEEGNHLTKKLNDFKTDKFVTDCAIYDYCHFNGIHQVYRTKLSETITSSLILGSFLLIVVGTAEGNIFISSSPSTCAASSSSSSSSSATTSDFKIPSFTKLEKVDFVGAKGPVKGLDFNYYYHKNNIIACIYAFYESGHVLIIDINSLAIISYTVAFGASKAADSERIIYPITVMPVLTAAFNVLEKPTLLAYTYSLGRMKQISRGNHGLSSNSYDSADSKHQSVPSITLQQQSSNPSLLTESTSAAASIEQQPPKPVPKRSFFSLGRTIIAKNEHQQSSSAHPSPSAGSDRSSTTSFTTSKKGNDWDSIDLLNIKLIDYSELDLPRYLSFISGNVFVTIALNKCLSLASKHNSMSSAALTISSIQTKEISKKMILSSTLFSFPSDNQESEKTKETTMSTSEIQSDSSYLSCVDEVGNVRIISFKTRSPIHQTNVLESVTDLEDDDNNSNNLLYGGTLLSNGSCYLLQKGIMQYSSTMIFSDEYASSMKPGLNLLCSPFPEKALPHSKPLDKELALSHGRELMLSNLKMQLKKRRSSVITLTAAPTDLYKIFAKTREQRVKEELFGNESTDNDSNSHSSASLKTKQSTNKVMNDMQELGKAYAERGEKINRVALKMDDFKQQALTYRQTAKAQKELLEKRNARWGLF
jgi:hypothetical protein